MKRAGIFIFIAVWLALLAVLVLTLPVRAMSWYDGECCNEKDCRQTILGEVERHDDGWYVVPLKLTVPFADPRVRRSLDPLIHICVLPAGGLRCIYVPEVAG